MPHLLLHKCRIALVSSTISLIILTGCTTVHSKTIFTVKAIQSHYPHSDDNSQTTLIIYDSGNTGFVRKILCLFPPDFQLDGGLSSLFGRDPPLTGIRKVRLLKKADQFAGIDDYFCEKVE